MWRLPILCLVGLVLAACGPTVEVPTPLPTAVPPDVLPSGDEGVWALSFKYEFPKETFGYGLHRYQLWIHCPVISAEDTATPEHRFKVSDEAMPREEPVYLRLHGLSDELFSAPYNTDQVIHPDRPVIAIVHLVGLSSQAAAILPSEPTARSGHNT